MLKGTIQGIKSIADAKTPKCSFCDKELALYQSSWCDQCYAQLHKWEGQYHACSICGRLRRTPGVCKECVAANRPFVRARAVSGYTGLAKAGLHRLKYQKARSLAQPLGKLMALVAAKDKKYRSCQAITYVPLSQHRLKERGFNQSEYLARVVGYWLRLPVINCLDKVMDTPPMAKLGKNERAGNLEGVFRLIDSPLAARMLLIDDVFTTGSTAAACCDAIKTDIRVKEVYVLTFVTGFKPDEFTA